MEIEDAYPYTNGARVFAVGNLGCIVLTLALGDVLLSYSAPTHLETHYKCGVPGSIGSGTTSTTPPEFRPVGDANTPRSTSE